jgi:hypothetical protein
MATEAQLYESILEEIRSPIEKAVTNALSSTDQHGTASLLRLEASFVNGDMSPPSEAQRFTLVSRILYVLWRPKALPA